MAAELGADIRGIDASDSLIAIAREQQPGNIFQVGEMEELPFPDDTFDIVTGINSFQFAGNIVNALKEARRVTRKNGKVVMAVWGKPEDCEASPVMKAISSFLPTPPQSNTPARPPLYSDGILEALASEAGLKPGSAEEIKCLWDFNNESDAVRTMLSAGLSTLAIQTAGEEKVHNSISRIIDGLKNQSGRVQLTNTFKCLVSVK